MDLDIPIIPDINVFPYQDRSLVEEQLKILQKVLRKERNLAGQSQVSPRVKSPGQHHLIPPQSLPLKSPTNHNYLLSQPSRVKSPSQQQYHSLSQSSPVKNNLPLSQPLPRSSPVIEDSIDLTLDLSDTEPDIEVTRKRPVSPNNSPASINGNLTVPSTSSVSTNAPTPKRPRQERENTTTTTRSENPSARRLENPQRPNENLTGRSPYDNYIAAKTETERRIIRDSVIRKMTLDGQRVHIKPPGQFDLKYAMSAPYFVFLSCIQNAPETWNQPYTITFPEILDISLGIIEKSLHINFMVDIGWLCLQHMLALQQPNFLVLLGQRYDAVPFNNNNIKIEKIVTPSPYGCHHSKISVLKYDKAIRIVVSTANLYEDDWKNRTQALWISQHLPYLPDGSDSIMGESRTGFKNDFIQYMKQYKLQSVKEWIDIFEKIDFSSVDVFFVASVPGSHKNLDKNKWGMKKLASLLSQHADLPSDGPKWPIVAQSSSIGNLGQSIDGWLGKEIIPALGSSSTRTLQSTPKFQFVYPTVDNYRFSFDGRNAICCLPYNMHQHSKQTWIKSYMCQWKAGLKGRDKAMPHSKIYTRLSPDLNKIPWITVTSANLSKAAWGYGKNSNLILSWEAGVVFFPKFVVSFFFFLFT